MSGGTPSVAAVIIGNEILSGKVEDENTPFLIKKLRSIGVALKRVEVIPDEHAVIVEAVRRAHENYDWVFTSGGVGPTHDDITLGCVAEALGRELVRHPEMERLLRTLYGDRLEDAHLRMADLPEGTVLVCAKDQRVPALQVENVYVLPGIPVIFREKVVALMPGLAATPFHVRYVYTMFGEGSLAPILDEVVAAFPDVEVGSYPTLTRDDYRVKVTIESKDEARTLEATDALLAQIPEERLVRVEDPSAGHD